MLKILFNIIKNNKGAVIALALLTFVSAATSLITPYLSGTFIDILSGQEGTLSVEKGPVKIYAQIYLQAPAE